MSMELASIALFRGLTDEQLALIGKHLHRKSFNAQTSIFSEDQPAEVLYIVLSGTVKIHAMQAGGVDVILGLRGPGEIIGEMGVVEGEPRSADAMTLEATTLLWMGRDAWQHWSREIPDLMENMIRILSRRLRLASSQLQCIAGLDVNGRVAHQLLAFAREYGHAIENDSVKIPLRLSQTDLAGLIGASRVRVAQVVASYRRQGYIAIDTDHRFVIKDAVRLRQLAR